MKYLKYLDVIKPLHGLNNMNLPKILGVLLHPILLAIPGVFLIVLSSTNDVDNAFYWTIISLIFSGIISLFVLFGVKKKFFNNLDVSNRKQRVILYPFAVAVIIIFAFYIHSQNGPEALVGASILFTIALVLLDLINRKIKASIHVASVAAMVTGIVLLYGGIAYFLILLIPISAWARIAQKRHTLSETVVGATCGIVLTVVGVFVVQLFVQ